MSLNIAIIGSGIAGLSAAYLLQPRHNVTVFEQNDYIGGHTHTVAVTTPSGEYAIDTGFIVFNYKTYPHFVKLLKQLEVAHHRSVMSFSFRSDKKDFEYSGDTLNTLFAQRSNLLNPKFYRLLWDIIKFNRQGKKLIHGEHDTLLSDFLHNSQYQDYFKEYYLKPMVSSIWSTPSELVMDFPVRFLLSFFENHGLLDIINRPQWYVVTGGSSAYIEPMVKTFKDKVFTNTRVVSIKRDETGVLIQTEQGEQRFDKVVIATHSDQALAMLDAPTADEYDILNSIAYQKNHVVLHTDSNVLPKRQRAWAAWNYWDTAGDDQTCLTYYMNALQGITAPEHFCVSVNCPKIDKKSIIQEFHYSHPIFNSASVNAKTRHQEINGCHHTYYTGAYWGNGFHEDGVVSSLNALSGLGVSL